LKQLRFSSRVTCFPRGIGASHRNTPGKCLAWKRDKEPYLRP
jgi:hypothetical protein